MSSATRRMTLPVPMPGIDSFKDSGDDCMWSNDGFAETVDGGLGNDLAYPDGVDTLVAIGVGAAYECTVIFWEPEI